MQEKLPQIAVPFSASSFSQKLFGLFGIHAISTYGQGIINGKSIHYHVKQFEGEYKGDKRNLQEIKDSFVEHMKKELKEQFPKYEEQAPEDWVPIAFHINGFEEDDKGRQIGVTYCCASDGIGIFPCFP